MWQNEIVNDETETMQYSTSRFLTTCACVAIAAGLFVMNYREIWGTAAQTDQFIEIVLIVHFYQRLWLWLLIGSIIASFLVPVSLRGPVRIFCVLAFCGLLYNICLGLGTL